MDQRKAFKGCKPGSREVFSPVFMLCKSAQNLSNISRQSLDPKSTPLKTPHGRTEGGEKKLIMMHRERNLEVSVCFF